MLSALNDRRRAALKVYPWFLDPSPAFTAASRLAIGLGNPAPAENSGLTLHHTYGFPIIPAASLRGITRRYLVDACAGYTIRTNGGEEAVPRWDQPVDAGDCFEAPSDEEVPRFFEAVSATIRAEVPVETCTVGQLDQFLFGDQGRGGAVVFFDAWPTHAPEHGWFEPDVLTPHHPGYYAGADTKPVANDGESPNIIAFVVLREGAAFESPLASAPRTAAMSEDLRESCLMVAERLLLNALDHLGIGAKTGSGYGRMTPPRNARGGYQ
ncbi:MAG: type III-B CRISPR module RAMP protein Cmr6 [Candidatus Eisenbacteria bacterium]|nr:type III-B CRISPR module RAMP protein Cmr6 [Candidatus Eisenbacteria bacterium]